MKKSVEQLFDELKEKYENRSDELLQSLEELKEFAEEFGLEDELSEWAQGEGVSLNG